MDLDLYLMRNILLAVVLTAALQAGAETVVDLSKQTFSGAESVADGQKFTLDLGTERRNWTHAKWSVLQLERPLDLSKHNAIVLRVTTLEPRIDAGVYLAVLESDGSWYSLPWACDLTRSSNVGVARFADFAQPMYHNPPGGNFRDENGRLDVDAITAIAIGVVNPLGIGKVSFTVTGIEALTVELPEPKPVQIDVTGKLIDINGTDTLPAGIFGGFNLKGIATGKATVTIDGKTYHVEGGEVKVGGETLKVRKGRVQIGKKKYKVNQPSVSRVKRYRLAADRKIMYDHGGNVHFGDEMTPIMINSPGDRTQPSFRLADRNWQANYEAAGRKAGASAKASKRTAYVEFWNEPYLNWANINRKNFNPKFYDQDKASEGGAVHIKHDGSVAPHLRWTRNYDAPPWQWCSSEAEWRRGKSEKGGWTLPYAMPYGGWYPGKWRSESAKLNPPADVKDGEQYEAGNGKTYTAFTPWHIYDETQFTYWSGQGMLKMYVEPLQAYGKALKEAGGDNVVLIAGWGNRPSEDHWAGWHRLYKPTIDATHEFIDAINDHDYGGDPRNLPSSYEVACAYGVTKYGKWLYGYNTECASSTDPQVYGDAANFSADAAKFQWVTTKIIHALQYVPDKARVFLHFGVGGGFWSDGGEGVAMDLLRNVRGRLVHVNKTDAKVYAIACIDGADPLAPRPDDLGDGQQLVVVVLNDDHVSRDVKLNVKAPGGTSFERMTQRTVAIKDGMPTLVGKAAEEKGDSHDIDVTLDAGQVMTFSFDLKGKVAADAKADVKRRQFFGDAILQDVTAKSPVKQTIEIDAAALSGTEQAWLRFVAERLDHGEGVVEFNGKTYELPAAVTPENTAWIRRLPIKLADLQAENALTFKVSSDAEAGYLLGTCSVEIE